MPLNELDHCVYLCVLCYLIMFQLPNLFSPERWYIWNILWESGSCREPCTTMLNLISLFHCVKTAQRLLIAQSILRDCGVSPHSMDE